PVDVVDPALVRRHDAVGHRYPEVALRPQDGEPQPAFGAHLLLRRPQGHEVGGGVPGGEDVRDGGLGGHAANSAAARRARPGPGPGAAPQAADRIAVTPWPPAAQIEINPRPDPLPCNSFASVATIRPPVAANGCPA